MKRVKASKPTKPTVPSSWSVEWMNEAKEDMKKFDHSTAVQIYAGIRKVQQNPLPQNEGGYGKPLGNRNGQNLTGFLKIKFLAIGVRVVYRLVRTKKSMKIVVVSLRSDGEVYQAVAKRKPFV